MLLSSVLGIPRQVHFATDLRLRPGQGGRCPGRSRLPGRLPGNRPAGLPGQTPAGAATWSTGPGDAARQTRVAWRPAEVPGGGRRRGPARAQPWPDTQPAGSSRWPAARDQQHPRSASREPSSPAARCGQATPGPAPAACAATGNDATTSSSRKLPSSRGAPAPRATRARPDRPACLCPHASPRINRSPASRGPVVARPAAPARDRHAGQRDPGRDTAPRTYRNPENSPHIHRSAPIVTWQPAAASGHVRATPPLTCGNRLAAALSGGCQVPGTAP